MDWTAAGASQFDTYLGKRPTRIDDIVDEQNRFCANLVGNIECAADVPTLLIGVLERLLRGSLVTPLDDGVKTKI
jgi:hypothetical protein